MDGYYQRTLSAENLERCYTLAPERIRRYLLAELRHVIQKIEAGDRVLDLGCGYGRTLLALAQRSGWVLGIDNSTGSLELARRRYGNRNGIHLCCMNAAQLAIAADSIDRVICIQNGISAFQVSARLLVEEAIRITRPGGTILFSTYSEAIWRHRLEWFELQAEAGLIGPIDYSRTGSGRIACVDGFTAGTVSPTEFRELISGLDVELKIDEIDESSIFFSLTPPQGD